MAATAHQRLTYLPPIAGLLAGVAVAGTTLALPGATLESVAAALGLPGLIQAAAPPLGGTARALLAIGGGLAGAAIGWAVAFLLFGPGGLMSPRTGVRRADAHPDAPTRRPVSGAELGPPPPPAPPPPEQDLPRDLDQPLAAFDPGAVPDVPMAPTPALPSLVPAMAPPPALQAGERIETFDLSPRAPGSGEPSIAELLQRLERGTARRAAKAVPGGN
jgi:hypothetical protein